MTGQRAVLEPLTWYDDPDPSPTANAVRVEPCEMCPHCRWDYNEPPPPRRIGRGDLAWHRRCHYCGHRDRNGARLTSPTSPAGACPHCCRDYPGPRIAAHVIEERDADRWYLRLTATVGDQRIGASYWIDREELDWLDRVWDRLERRLLNEAGAHPAVPATATPHPGVIVDDRIEETIRRLISADFQATMREAFAGLNLEPNPDTETEPTAANTASTCTPAGRSPSLRSTATETTTRTN